MVTRTLQSTLPFSLCNGLDYPYAYVLSCFDGRFSEYVVYCCIVHCELTLVSYAICELLSEVLLYKFRCIRCIVLHLLSVLFLMFLSLVSVVSLSEVENPEGFSFVCVWGYVACRLPETSLPYSLT